MSNVAPRLGLPQQTVAHFGGFGVLSQSVKVFAAGHSSLVWIQFAFVLPYALYLIVDQYAQRAILNSIFPDLQDFSLLSLNGAPDLDLQKWLGILLLAALALLNFCFSLFIVGAVFYSVGKIYEGRSPTFSEVVHAVPRLWARLFVTAIVNLLLVLAIVAVYIIFVLIFQFTVPVKVLQLLVIIFGVIFVIPLIIVTIKYNVANGVTCYEEPYGITAFRRAKHLLHDKWSSATLLFVVLAVATILVSFLLESPSKLNNEFHWRWLLLSILYVIFTSYLTELICISWAVFYFSCAANFEQNAAPHPDDALEASYEAIPPSA